MASLGNIQPGSDSQRGNDASIDTTDDILPGFKSIDSFSQNTLQSLLVATKLSNDMPSSGNNWDYYASFSGFNKIMKVEGEKILSLLTSVLRHQGVQGRIDKRPDLQEKFDLLTDFNDAIFERVGTSLDEAAGIKKDTETLILECSAAGKQVLSGTWNKKIHERSASMPATDTVRLLTAKNVQRPQLKFRDKIDNSHNPFIPKLKEKPNAVVPLAILLERIEDTEHYSHPYEYELLHWKPIHGHLGHRQPVYPRSKSETPLIIVTTETDVKNMLKDLQKQKEIAIDLEHHSYRSFLGITCLMQISTRHTDYIIDTLSLWDRLQCLNEVFTNPSIVKVFHGADLDVLWLQRDLGLYLVNLFDTHQAAKALNFPRLSLAVLLRHYCNVFVDKQFQLADWRIRPLPEKMVEYARDDTHYLLYIYDTMKNELLDRSNPQKNLLKAVLSRSKELCEMRYEKPRITEDSHLELHKKSRKLFNARQKYALKYLYRWRDKLAREEDESTGYVLPNHTLLQIAEMLPRDMQGILACCNPIPTLVRQHLVHLHRIILEARAQPLTKIDLEQSPVKVASQPHLKVDFNDLLHCPHDISHDQEGGDNLPTLLGQSSSVNITQHQHSLMENMKVRFKSKPEFQVFMTPESLEGDSGLAQKIHEVTFISPYERFKLVRPFCQSLSEETTQKDNTDDARMKRLQEHFMDLTSKTPERVTKTVTEKEAEVKKREKESKQKQNSKEEEIQTVRQMQQENSKKRLSSEMDSPTSVSAQSKKQKQKDTINKKDAVPEFTPYDYSNVNYDKMFGGSNWKKNTPFQKGNVKAFRGSNLKSKCFRKGGNKSMTCPKFQEKS